MAWIVCAVFLIGVLIGHSLAMAAVKTALDTYLTELRTTERLRRITVEQIAARIGLKL